MDSNPQQTVIWGLDPEDLDPFYYNPPSERPWVPDPSLSPAAENFSLEPYERVMNDSASALRETPLLQYTPASDDTANGDNNNHTNTNDAITNDENINEAIANDGNNNDPNINDVTIEKTNDVNTGADSPRMNDANVNGDVPTEHNSDAVLSIQPVSSVQPTLPEASSSALVHQTPSSLSNANDNNYSAVMGWMDALPTNPTNSNSSMTNWTGPNSGAPTANPTDFESTLENWNWLPIDHVASNTNATSFNATWTHANAMNGGLENHNQIAAGQAFHPITTQAAVVPAQFQPHPSSWTGPHVGVPQVFNVRPQVSKVPPKVSNVPQLSRNMPPNTPPESPPDNVAQPNNGAQFHAVANRPLPQTPPQAPEEEIAQLKKDIAGLKATVRLQQTQHNELREMVRKILPAVGPSSQKARAGRQRQSPTKPNSSVQQISPSSSTGNSSRKRQNPTPAVDEDATPSKRSCFKLDSNVGPVAAMWSTRFSPEERRHAFAQVEAQLQELPKPRMYQMGVSGATSSSRKGNRRSATAGSNGTAPHANAQAKQLPQNQGRHGAEMHTEQNRPQTDNISTASTQSQEVAKSKVQALNEQSPIGDKHTISSQNEVQTSTEQSPVGIEHAIGSQNEVQVPVEQQTSNEDSFAQLQSALAASNDNTEPTGIAPANPPYVESTIYPGYYEVQPRANTLSTQTTQAPQQVQSSQKPIARQSPKKQNATGHSSHNPARVTKKAKNSSMATNVHGKADPTPKTRDQLLKSLVEIMSKDKTPEEIEWLLNSVPLDARHKIPENSNESVNNNIMEAMRAYKQTQARAQAGTSQAPPIDLTNEVNQGALRQRQALEKARLQH